MRVCACVRAYVSDPPRPPPPSVQKSREEEQETAGKLSAAMAELSALKESACVSEKDRVALLCRATSEADSLRRRVEGLDHLAADLAAAHAEVAALRQQLYDGELARRKLHNMVQVCECVTAPGHTPTSPHPPR